MIFIGQRYSFNKDSNCRKFDKHSKGFFSCKRQTIKHTVFEDEMSDAIRDSDVSIVSFTEY